MEEFRILTVSEKEHIADECIEPVANPNVLLGGLTLESSLHLALRVKRRFHLPEVIMCMVQIGLLHFLRMLPEDTV